MLDNSNVALIVPTFKRKDFLYRFLHYYAVIKSNMPIYIADSTPLEQVDGVRKVVEHFKNQLTIHYHYIPDKNPLGATLEILKNVKEKYVCWSGDDDYQVPSGVNSCTQFLDANPGYISARGSVVPIFSMESSKPFGKITVATLYDSPKSIEAETGCERLLQHFSNYFVIVYAVYRTKEYKEILKMVNTIPQHLVGELYFCGSSVVSGKCKIIDNCVSFIRQDHEARGHYLSFFESLLEKEYFDSYKEMQKVLANKLQNVDNIPASQAYRAATEAISKYFEHCAQRALSSPRLYKLHKYPFPEPLKPIAKSILRLLFKKQTQFQDKSYFFGSQSPFNYDVKNLGQIISKNPSFID